MEFKAAFRTLLRYFSDLLLWWSSFLRGQRSKVKGHLLPAFVSCAFVTRCELVDRHNPDMPPTFEPWKRFTHVFRALSPPRTCVARCELVDRHNPDMLTTFEATERFTRVFCTVSTPDPSEPP